MKQKLNAWLTCFTFMCVNNNFVHSRFLGGTISWVPDISTNDVRFTYRLSWEKGTGPCGSNCSPSQIGSSIIGSVNSSTLSSLHWTYRDGTTNKNLSDINYYVTSVSITNRTGWEQGENSFTFSSLPTNKPFAVHLENIPWMRSSLDTNDTLGYMDTKVDLRVRNDTAKPNASPFVSVPAFLGIAFGCSTIVRLQANDPDGDIIRCRWAELAECGQACSTLPKDAVKLNKASCTLTIHAFSELGFQANATYRLAITIEDLPHGLIDVEGEKFTRSQPLSRIPIQISLRTSAAGMVCNNQNFTFANLTPSDGFRYYTPPADVQNSYQYKRFYLHTDHTNSTEFMVSTPRFALYNIKPGDKGRSNVIQLTTIWRPTSSQTGDQQTCVWGLQADGITTDSRCITQIISDTENCHNGTCFNNGTCVNLFNVTNDICHCQDGFKPPFCISETICADEPCENKGTCRKNGAKAKCSCEDGFGGFYCEQEKNNCENTPCKNDATCLDLQNGFKCLCAPTFTGDKCEDSTNKASNQENPDKQVVPAWIAALASIGGLLACVGLGACIYKLKPDKATGTEAIEAKQTKRVKQKLNKVQTVEMTTVKPYS